MHPPTHAEMKHYFIYYLYYPPFGTYHSLWNISFKLDEYLWKCQYFRQLNCQRSLEDLKSSIMLIFKPDLSKPIFRPPLPPCPTPCPALLPPCGAPTIWVWYLDHMLSLVQFGEQPSVICVAQTQINTRHSITFSYALENRVWKWMSTLLSNAFKCLNA